MSKCINTLKKPYSRINLSVDVKTAVWNKYIGKEYGLGQCFIGCGNLISQSNFECGHVQSKKFGGTNKIENLRPICSRCYKSISTQNMFEFMELHGFTSTSFEFYCAYKRSLYQKSDVVPMEVD